MIKFVFLDLDDTIFDFHKAEKAAVSKTLEEFGIEANEAVVLRYSEINKQMWQRLERGELTREEVLVERFRSLFSELGVSCNANGVRKRYEELLAIGHYYIEGAHELLEELYGKYSLYLASNGTARVQNSRIASSDISKYFNEIFISEEIGYNKPSADFFRLCFERIDGFSKDEAIIVGDSLSSDILGGINAEIKTCLFNPHGKENKTDIKPHYEIRALSELPLLLSKI